MESTQQSDRETYRAIVLGRTGNELLLVPAGHGFLLPSVEILRRQRIAESLTAAMRKAWGYEVVCMFSPDATTPTGSPKELNYQVMEAWEPVAGYSRYAQWVHVASLSEQTFADPADHAAVQRSLTECERCADAPNLGPFARLGWFRELQGWIEGVIGSLGLGLSGCFSQLNASPSFSLVRFGTNGRAVWFKAVGTPNLREFPITLALARFLPQYVPPLLAARPEWNGWLVQEVEGANLRETHDARHWNTAASALAKLQIESTDRSGVLIHSGARDMRASTLLKLVRPFLDAMGQLMEKQIKAPPPVLSWSELTLLGEQIEEVLSLNTDLGIPDALGNLDLNPGNMVVSESACRFLDWAESCVGHPFFIFQYLLEHFRQTVGADPAREAELTDCYARPWMQVVSTEAVAKALTLTPLLAAFAYAVGCCGAMDEERRQNPRIAGYLRGLTRRISREASHLKRSRLKCPC